MSKVKDRNNIIIMNVIGHDNHFTDWGFTQSVCVTEGAGDLNIMNIEPRLFKRGPAVFSAAEYLNVRIHCRSAALTELALQGSF